MWDTGIRLDTQKLLIKNTSKNDLWSRSIWIYIMLLRSFMNKRYRGFPNFSAHLPKSWASLSHQSTTWQDSFLPLKSGNSLDKPMPCLWTIPLWKAFFLGSKIQISKTCDFVPKFDSTWFANWQLIISSSHLLACDLRSEVPIASWMWCQWWHCNWSHPVGSWRNTTANTLAPAEGMKNPQTYILGDPRAMLVSGRVESGIVITVAPLTLGRKS